MPSTGLRFFTVYGPWGRPDMAYFKFALAIAEGRTIDLYNGGNMLRDFTYIDDVVEGIVRVMDRPATADIGWDPVHPDPAVSSAPFHIYNIGNNRAEPVLKLVSLLEDGLGKKARQSIKPMEAGDVLATEADVSELERDFGWKPVISLEQGIAGFIDWFKAYHRSAAA
jgi:UDP-glucuronate 4-epimerase